MNPAPARWPRRDGLVLGTALWGWGVDKAEAFAMLGEFADWGGVWVDSAVNYPINGVPEDHGRALAWVGEWVRAHPHSAVKVWVKVGAVDNSGSQDHNLRASAFYVWEELIRGIVDDALGCLAVHWDTREDHAAIAETVAGLRELARKGLELGLSGINRPDLYALAAPDLATRWWIQVKENLTTNDARVRLADSLPSARYVAYGINLGGRLLPSQDAYRSSSSLRGGDPVSRTTLDAVASLGRNARPQADSVHTVTLLHAACNASLDGVVIGPRTAAQLRSALGWWDVICEQLDESTRASLSGLLLPARP